MENQLNIQNIKYNFDNPIFFSHEKGEISGAWTYFTTFKKFSYIEYINYITTVRAEITIMPPMPIEYINVEFEF